MLSMIEKLINEHGSSTILKERLELINDKYELLEQKLANAENENEKLHKEVEELKSKLSTETVNMQYVEYMGAKFKRKNSGGFEETAYCPKCNGAMFALDSSMPFFCTACKTSAGFNGRDLKKIVRDVTKKYA